jgi:hypothetical protein
MAKKVTFERDPRGLIAPADRPAGPEMRRRQARRVLVAFLATFTWLRIMIFEIMDRRLPDMFVYVKGTHVHHLNFGIFLLALLGAYVLFGRPGRRGLEVAASLYGIGLALTFDEFGMWLHLGGGYWQRASFDAVTVIAGFLILMAFLPPPRELRGRHAVAAAVLIALGAVFFVLLLRAIDKHGDGIGPRPAIRGSVYSHNDAAAGTMARSASEMAPRAQALRQMPQP